MDEATKYVKGPNDVLDYILDLTLFLGDDTVITASAVEAVGVVVDSVDVNPIPLNLNNEIPVDTGKAVIVWLSGGNAGSHGKVVIRVNTQGGRQKDIAYPVTVTNNYR